MKPALVLIPYLITMSTLARAAEPSFTRDIPADLAREAKITEEAALTTARTAVPHGNVLSIGGRLVPETDLLDIVRTWLATPFDGGRHAARIAKLADLGTPADAGLAAFFPAR